MLLLFRDKWVFFFFWKKISFKEWPYILHPRPVAIIASGYSGRVSAMPASWITPVSRNPPVVAVAISKKRFTYELIIKSHEFSVNILPKEFMEKIHYLGCVSGREEPNKIAKTKLTVVKGRRINSPIILESLAIAECFLWKNIEAGDHNIIVGRIVETYAKQEFNVFNEEIFEKILLHVGRNIYTHPTGMKIVANEE